MGTHDFGTTLLLSIAILGIFAGILTTLAGQGGGMFLLLVLGVLASPHEALAISAPALLLGNLHRGFLYRREANIGAAIRLACGAIPGAVLGGFFAGRAPALLINVVLVALTAFAIFRAFGKVKLGPGKSLVFARLTPGKSLVFARLTPGKSLVFARLTLPIRAFPAAGAIIGVLTGTSGGAGVMVSPILLSTGLTGKAFVGTTSMVACSMHIGRVFSYVETGLIRRDQWIAIACLAITIFAGNALANRIRANVSGRTCTRLEYGTLTACVLLSVFGVAR